MRIMVNKSKKEEKAEDKCNCEHLCIECKHIYEQEGKYPRCYASAKEIINCVDGEKETEYKLCEQLNKNGQCKKWKRDEAKYRKQKIINALKDYLGLNDEIYHSSYYPSIGRYLAHQLLDYLNDRETDFFIPSYEECERVHYKYNENKNYTKAYKKYANLEE